MKKLQLGAVVGVSALVLLTGCGGSGNKVNCTANVDEDGHKYKAEIIAELDNDKVKDVTASMTFENADDADQLYNSYTAIINMAKQYAQEGQEVPDIDIKKNGKTVTISNYADFASTMESENDEKLIGITKDEFIKKIESTSEDDIKWSCK